MALFPALVAVVCAVFAAILFQHARQRHRPYQIVWTAALLMGALAAASFVGFLAGDRNITLFRLYYLFGGLLMAAYLGLGSVYLHLNRRLAHYVAVVVVVLSVGGAAALLLSPINRAALLGPNVEAGTQAVSGLPVLFIVVLNTFGAVAVIAGAALSAWRLWRGAGPARLFAANVLIATGTVLASLAGSLARLTGSGSAFWLLLAFGFVVLFAGFMLTTPWAASLMRGPASQAQVS